MSELFTRAYLLATVERALKTLAQVIVALFANDVANVLTVDWTAALAVALTAMVVSVATSVLSAKAGPQGSPSLVDYQPAPQVDPAT